MFAKYLKEREHIAFVLRVIYSHFFMQVIKYNKCLNPILYVPSAIKWKSSKDFLDFWAPTEKKDFYNVRKLYSVLGNVRAKEFIHNLFEQKKELARQGYEFNINVLPCRKCINCQRKRAFEWTVRNSFESKNYNEETIVFITLTINNESLLKYFVTDDGVPTLNYFPFQLFMKRLRKTFFDYSLRFYMCGEYGSKGGRPHFHLLLYGLPFEKLVVKEYSKNSHGQMVYTSDILSSLWTYGFNTVALCNDFTTMYVSQYCTKKYVNNFQRLNKAEFNIMSRRPGIGAGIDTTKLDEIYKDGKIYAKIGDKVYECMPFKFFDNLFEKNHGEDALNDVKFIRSLSHIEESPLDSIDYNFDTDKNYGQYLEELEFLMRENCRRKETICEED